MCVYRMAQIICHQYFPKSRKASLLSHYHQIHSYYLYQMFLLTGRKPILCVLKKCVSVDPSNYRHIGLSLSVYVTNKIIERAIVDMLDRFCKQNILKYRAYSAYLFAASSDSSSDVYDDK